MTAITQALSAALLHFVWQGTILGGLLWVTLLALKNRSAAARYAAGCAVLAAMAAMPVVTTAVLYVRAAPADPGIRAVTEVSQAIVAAATGSASLPVNWLAWLESWTLPAWSLGVILFSLRLVRGYKHAFALGRRGDPADATVVAVVQSLARRMSVTRPIRVLISAIADAPSVVGWLRPVILLPAATVLGLTPQQLEAVLAHELGHIRRHDYFVNMLQMLVETLLFYHPAVWWSSNRIRIERELCCDDLAVNSCGDALCYARALTTLEKLRRPDPGVTSSAMAAAGGPLLYRIRRLMGTTSRTYAPSRLPGVLATSLALACLFLNVGGIRGQNSQNVDVGKVLVHEEPQERVIGLDSPGVRVDLQGSNVIHRTGVLYPLAAMEKGVKGTVELEATLDDSGNVSDAHVLRGPEALRRAALQSILDWHFSRDGGATRLVNITFEPPPAGTGQEVFVHQGREGRHVVEARGTKMVLSGGSEHVWFSANPEGGTQTVMTITQDAELQKMTDALKSKLTDQRVVLETLRQDLDQAVKDDSQALATTLRLKIGELELESRNRETKAVFGWQAGTRVSMAGRSLSSISAGGLSDRVRNELLSRLPVRAGDVLSQESMAAVQKIIRDFDEHLEINFIPTADGQTELQILVPGSGKARFVMFGGTQ